MQTDSTSRIKLARSSPKLLQQNYAPVSSTECEKQVIADILASTEYSSYELAKAAQGEHPMSRSTWISTKANQKQLKQ